MNMNVNHQHIMSYYMSIKYECSICNWKVAALQFVIYGDQVSKMTTSTGHVGAMYTAPLTLDVDV